MTMTLSLIEIPEKKILKDYSLAVGKRSDARYQLKRVHLEQIILNKSIFYFLSFCFNMATI